MDNIKTTINLQEGPSISSGTTTMNPYLSYPDLQSNSTIQKTEIEPLQIKEKNYNSHVVVEISVQKITLRQIKTQLISAIAISWVSILIGYCSAYTSPASTSLERDFKLEYTEMTWITSLMPLGAVAGGILGGTLIENLGRKWTLLFTDLLFMLAFVVNVFAQSYIEMYVSRVIAGLSVGILSLTLPVYLAETVQPEVRGTLGLLPSAFINIGILLCYLFGTFYEWRALALVGVILSIPFQVVFWMIKETPRYLISKNKEEETYTVLQWFRGANTNIDKEFQELKEGQVESYKETASLKILFSTNNLKLMGIVLGLMTFHQWSGINAVIFYTTQIFDESKSSIDKSISTTIVGGVNFVATFTAAVLIDKFGRKKLLYISAVSMILSLGVLGTYFFLKDVSKINVDSMGFVPLLSLVVYVLGFSLGFGPIPWLMMGEILPAQIKGPAISVATAFNWTCTFIVTKIFLLLAEVIGFHFTFWTFGGIVFLGFLFTIYFVPETRGQSLADIERKLAGIKVRRFSSVANLDPMESTF